jgi:phytoene dehydrogenase-like protein
VSQLEAGRRQRDMRTDWDVIVVGGGLAGLAAAATAKQLDARVVLLEAHGPGGRARTVEREGFTLNMGAHALYVGGEGWRALRSLGVSPAGAAPPLGRYRALTGGTHHLLPTGPRSLLRTGVLSPLSKVRLISLLGRVPRMATAAMANTSVADWLKSCRLRPDADAVVRAIIRLSTYCADVDEFSAGAAVAQLQLAAKGGVIYLHGGWAQLIDALADGVDIRVGTEVTGVDRVGDHLEIDTPQGVMTASAVVVATGAPAAVRRVLPVDPGWGELGPPVTAACLDLGVDRVPKPGYLLSLDEPVYINVQSPPARQAPQSQAVVAAIRYGARSAAEDRPQLERLVAEAGVRTEQVVTSRFLAHLSVSSTLPRASSGGLAGRPDITDTGVPGVTMAGDWVGPVGLLADAALASGRAAGILAGRHCADPSTKVA